MYGNLKAFAGHDAYNEYAEHLREIGEPMLPHGALLWIMRVGLIVALVVHVYSAVVLWRRARRARTVRYVVKKHTGATFASRMMRWGGVTILLFVVWHLLNFTIGKVNVDRRADQRPLQPAGRQLLDLVADADLPGRDGHARGCTCTTASGAPRRPSA